MVITESTALPPFSRISLPKLEHIAESAATAAFGQIFEFSPTDLTVPGGVSPAYRSGNQIAYFGFKSVGKFKKTVIKNQTLLANFRDSQTDFRKTHPCEFEFQSFAPQNS